MRYYELRVLESFTHIAARYPDGDLSPMDPGELAELIAYIKMRDTEIQRELMAAGTSASLRGLTR